MAPTTFIATKEHRRFVEFANAVRRQRTIGVCYGQAGIGKTLSAKRYANWSREAETLVEQWGRREESDHQIYKDLAKNRTVFFTPGVLTTPKQIKEELAQLTTRTSICIDEHLRTTGAKTGPPIGQDKHVELIIIDESERLNSTALEVLRDRYDRNNIALVLIGMPASKNSSVDTHSSTAGSDSPTNTVPSARKNCTSFYNDDGAHSDRP